ncbi:MAG: hypothetical protein KC731_36840, partial [Myxococcales bacterium]|nr:hypothetical protein [Myxococcales bacterium]
DGFRWGASLRMEGEHVYFRQAKTNYSRHMADEILLVRGDNGVLRVASEGERIHLEETREEAAEEARREREESRIVEMRERLGEAIRKAKAPLTSRKQLEGLVSGTQSIKSAAVTQMLSDGELVRVAGEGGSKAHFRLAVEVGNQ